MEHTYVDYKRVFVFLTISGDPPSDEAYVSMSYSELASIVETTVERRENQVNDEIKLFVQQYLEMVRRHIVEDSEIQGICRRIYRTHRRALDLLFENRPDRATEVAHAILYYLESSDVLDAFNTSKTYIHFLPQFLSLPSIQYEGTPILRWVIINKDKQARFKLELQPGDRELRERIFEMAKGLPRVFGKPKSKLSPKYHTFFSETWISKSDYDELDEEGIRQRIDEHVKSLVERKGEAMANALSELA